MRLFSVNPFQLGWEDLSYPLTSDYRLPPEAERDFAAARYSLARAKLTSQGPAVNLTATPGEAVPFSFVVENDGSEAVKVSPTAQIDAQVQFKVYYPWLQAGRSNLPSRGVIVPELLLQTNEPDFTDQWGGKLFRDYTPPALAISGPAEAVVPAGGFVRFYGLLRVPSDAASNLGGQVVVGGQALPLRVRILRLRLPAPSRRPWIYCQYRPEGSPNNDLVSEETYRQHLRYIRDLGLNGITLYGAFPGPPFVFSQRVFELLWAEGFTNLLYLPMRDEAYEGQNLSATLQRAAAAGFREVYVYGKDEPENAAADVSTHLRRAAAIRQVGGKIAVGTTRAMARRLIPRNLDLPIYSVLSLAADDYVARLFAGSSGKSAFPELYYWASWIERPVVNRLLAGFFLFASHLNGICPYTYGATVPFSPYRDPDKRPDAPIRIPLMVYPSQKGPVWTIQSEGLRAGITDLRYMQALQEHRPPGYDTLEASKASRLAKLIDPEDLFILHTGRFRQAEVGSRAYHPGGLTEDNLEDWRRDVQAVLGRLFQSRAYDRDGRPLDLRSVRVRYAGGRLLVWPPGATVEDFPLRAIEGFEGKDEEDIAEMLFGRPAGDLRSWRFQGEADDHSTQSL